MKKPITLFLLFVTFISLVLFIVYFSLIERTYESTPAVYRYQNTISLTHRIDTWYNCSEIVPQSDIRETPPDSSNRVIKIFDNWNYFQQQQSEIMMYYCQNLNERFAQRKTLENPVSLPIKIWWEVPKKWFWYDKDVEKTKNCPVPCKPVSSEKKADIVLKCPMNLKPFKKYANSEESYITGRKNGKFTAFISQEMSFLDLDITFGTRRYFDYLLTVLPFNEVRVLTEIVVTEKFEDNAAEFGLPYKPYNRSTFREEFNEIFQSKKSDVLVATFVSHCTRHQEHHPHNFRNLYLQELKSLTKIDFYGKCGKKKEPSWPNIVEKNDIKKTRYVRKMLVSQQYKFHMTFENSMSYGYYTEKLKHAIHALYTIPIYYGAIDIDEFFPRELREKKYKIFINVRDFLNPKDLVDYLNYLDKNDTAYMEYFQWRFDGYESFEIKEKVDKQVEKGFMCNLCEYHYNFVNENDVQIKPPLFNPLKSISFPSPRHVEIENKN